jgi:hypothetical protein
MLNEYKLALLQNGGISKIVAKSYYLTLIANLLKISSSRSFSIERGRRLIWENAGSYE